MRDPRIAVFHTTDASVAKQWRETRRPGMKFAQTKTAEQDGSGRPYEHITVKAWFPVLGFNP